MRPAISLDQPPGLYHRALGDMTVTAVNDGTFDATFDLIVGIDQGECERTGRGVLSSGSAEDDDERIPDTLQRANHRLIDAGCGTSMGPTLGKLCRNLCSMGVEPADIDTILVTHPHPDHVNGLIDAAGQALFPRAEVWVNEIDLQFFSDPASPSRAPEETREFFDGAKAALGPYDGRIRTVREGPVVPGVCAVSQPGHTPGHTGWMVESNGESIMIWGDIVHMPQPSDVTAPEAGTMLDIDRDLAVATRRRALDMAATDRLRVAGIHHGFSRLRTRRKARRAATASSRTCGGGTLSLDGRQDSPYQFGTARWTTHNITPMSGRIKGRNHLNSIAGNYSRHFGRRLAGAVPAGLLRPAFAQEKLRIAWSSRCMGINYFDVTRDGGQAAADELGDVELIYTGPTAATVEQQIADPRHADRPEGRRADHLGQ